ncbi:MAG: hypothetical protein E7158_00730 [Firmicutes bacterium]|nr:hypothetical protein [Bacillota bacterium]
MKKIFLVLIMFFLLITNVYADEELLIENIIINNALMEPKFDRYNNYYSVTISKNTNTLDIKCEYDEEKYKMVISNNENLVQNKLVYVTIYNEETEEQNTYIFKIYVDKIEDTVFNIENNKEDLKVKTKEVSKKIAPSIGAVCLSLIIIFYYILFLR